MKVSDQTLFMLVELGEKIKKARIESNMSQVELGEKIGVTRYTIGALESGRAKVAIGTVFEASMVVGLPILGMKTDNDEPSLTGNGNSESIKLDDDYF